MQLKFRKDYTVSPQKIRLTQAGADRISFYLKEEFMIDTDHRDILADYAQCFINPRVLQRMRQVIADKS